MPLYLGSSELKSGFGSQASASSLALRLNFLQVLRLAGQAFRLEKPLLS